jgi:class 3 adenylate cyclase/CRP-like cAMP-binding protein/tetratricopeptide (TPR) repeat protein
VVQKEPEAELEERKVVTVLFADLTASTELAARLDPEDLRRILQPFFEAMVEEIRRFDGTVEKFIGDAIVAVFGFPAAHEDDPERAVRAALAMHRRLRMLNGQLRATSGVELAMRVGVNTGDVVTATGVDRENLVTGEPVHIAARLQALGRPGSIVVGERTHRDTRHLFAFSSLGEVAVKGIDRPLPAWELDSASGAEQGAGVGATAGVVPMVGREDELRLLELAFARAVRERRPGLASVLGPAGIGKSRLSHEFAARVTARGSARVLRGRCLPYGEGLTYWPMANVLKADTGILDSDPPDIILAKALDRVERELRPGDRGTGITGVLLSSIGVPVRPDPLAGAEPSAARELITRSWRTYVEAMAAEQPLVILLEDLHWADEHLLDLVEALAGRVSAPVLFVCMTRPDLTERRPSWGGGLVSSMTIPLSPLSAEDGRHLVDHLLEGMPAPPEAIDPLLRRAEGNPFYAQELLRMVIETGSLARDDGRWVLERPLPESLPDTVQGVIASRIDMLPPDHKRVLQDAAVVGRIFWQGTVERLGSSGTSAAIDELVRRGLVWERESSVIRGERELIFNHILTRDVAYSSIPKARRGPAHAQALSWTEGVTAGREEEFAEILAYHAERSGDQARTARYAMFAGHRNRRVFATAEAIRWYDRALSAAEAADLADPALTAEIALSRGEAHELLGAFPEALADNQRAVSDARLAQDGLLEARALAGLAHMYWMLDRFEEGRAVQAEALEKARSVGTPEVLTRLLFTAGTLAFGQGRFREALGMHREALRVAREAGDSAGEAMARHGLCETLYFLGPFDEALEEGWRADELFRALGQRPMIYHNMYMVAWLLAFKGRLGDARERITESIEGSRELGNRRDEGYALLSAVAFGSLGNYGKALDETARGEAIARELAIPRLEIAATGGYLSLLADLGRFDQIEAELERVQRLADQVGTDFTRARLRTWWGWVALHRGDRDAAEARFREGREMAKDVLLDRLTTLVVEIQAWADAEDEERLGAAAKELAEAAEGESPFYGAWAEFGRALAALLRGDHAEAAETAATVAASARTSSDPTLAWRAARIGWKALQAQGRAWDAAVELARAAGLLRDLMATVPGDELLGSFVARPEVAEVLTAAARDWIFAGLSPDELETVRAVARMSEFTAGGHVFRRGDPGTALYVIDRGTVSITVDQAGGETVELARLEPLDCFGEIALLDEGSRTAGAVAGPDCRLLEFPRDDFLRILADHPPVAERLLGTLGDRLRDDEKLAAAGFPDVPARLAGAIQRLAEREGRAGAVLEVFPVFLEDRRIRYVRPNAGGSIRITSPGSGHPSDLVLADATGRGLQATAVHSTSWRHERDRLVLTYLAVLDEVPALPDGLQAADVVRHDLARGSATGPPQSIGVEQVVEHALRHLSWLVRDDPVIRDRLARDWAGPLDAYEPEPFRSLASGAGPAS